MTQTPCPSCKADIESDSIFCDQCGTELKKCPSCGSFCKGNFCPKCGVAAVKASEASSAGNQQSAPQPRTGQTAQQPQPTPQQHSAQPKPIQPQPQPLQHQPMPSMGYGDNYPQARPSTNPDANGYPGTSIPGTQQQPTALVCHAMGITLPLQNGAVIGRVSGNYVPLLSRCNYISGTHARLDFDGNQWTITDLGSRNGTAVNGIPCTPTAVLARGSVVRIAQWYDFIVE